MVGISCLICLETPTNPKLCPKCSKIFCHKCLETWYSQPPTQAPNQPPPLHPPLGYPILQYQSPILQYLSIGNVWGPPGLPGVPAASFSSSLGLPAQRSCPHCQANVKLTEYVKAEYFETLTNSLKAKKAELEQKVSRRLEIF